MRSDAPAEAAKSVPELLRDLGDEMAQLVRAEIALAKAELLEKSKPAAASAGMFGTGALLGLGAFAAFTTFLITVLALAMPVWLAALIVTVVYGAIAGVLALTARKKLQEATPLVPEQAAQTVKEDIEWVKTRAQSGLR